jgi:glycosyltransferase involved in cell wall biosynthesis
MQPAAPGLRTLVIGDPIRPPDAELRRLAAEDLIPDAFSVEAAIGPTYVDERYLTEIPGVGGRILRQLPFVAAQVAEVLRHGGDYDAVLTWSDLPAIAVAGAIRLRRRRPAHVAILMWPSKPKKARLLRITQRGIDRFLVHSPLQRQFMEKELGIDLHRFVDTRMEVDTDFWRPLEGAGDLICSVGREMRDYKTLVDALRPLQIRCHIATGGGIFNPTSEDRWSDDVDEATLPPTITLGPKSFSDLRQLYARARFVVVPLVPSDHDNGITTILEAFAMGKTVICTETPGQVGVLEHGVNCLRVPPFDAEALRAALRELWDDPDKCERLGAAGREVVVRRHNLDQRRSALTQAVCEAVALRSGSPRT